MSKQVDLFDSTYEHFSGDVHSLIRQETFGNDIGQNSWLTSDEYDKFISWLEITKDNHVLEIASGSGGPALYLVNKTGCRLTGIDANENGITSAVQSLINSNNAHLVNFKLADANAPLPFKDHTFDSIMCIDSMNHFPDRLHVLKEWKRVLRKGGRALFTDPVAITGPVTNEELAVRSSIGLFLFVPDGYNEKLIAEAGFHLLKIEDVSENAAQVSGRWKESRQRNKNALVHIEGEERFEGLQKFFEAVHKLTSEKRLSRIVYLVENTD